MKGYQLFLAYYTLAAGVGLFIWSVFFGPKPQSLLLTLFLLPIGIYFWLILSGHSFEPTQSHSLPLPLIVLATLFVSTASILTYTLTTSGQEKTASAQLLLEVQSLRQDITKLSPSAAETEASTAAQLRQIKADLATLKGGPAASSGPDLTNEDAGQVGIVTLKDSKNQTSNVYQDKTLKGTIIGKIEFGKTYPFVEKDLSWYLIILGEKQGYLDSSLVKEVLNNP